MAESSHDNPFNSAVTCSVDNIEVTLTVFGPPVPPCGVHTQSALFLNGLRRTKIKFRILYSNKYML